MEIRIESSMRGLFQSPAAFERAQVAALTYGAMFAQAAMVKRVPVNTGMLRASIQISQPYNMPVDNSKQIKIGPSGGPSLYAYFVENGRLPGKLPPYEAIAYWVQRKLQISPAEDKFEQTVQAIRFKIGLKGTKGAEFVKKTVMLDGAKIRELMTRVFQRAAGL